MLGMMGNKKQGTFISAITSGMTAPKKEAGAMMDEPNRDQVGIDASSQLISAIKSGDAERVFRSFKLIMEHCKESMESDEGSTSDSDYSSEKNE